MALHVTLHHVKQNAKKRGKSARHAGGVRPSQRSYGHEHGAFVHQPPPSPDDLPPLPHASRTPTSPSPPPPPPPPRVPARTSTSPPPPPAALSSSSSPPPRHADARRSSTVPPGNVCAEAPLALTHRPQHWRTRPGHPRPVIQGNVGPLNTLTRQTAATTRKQGGGGRTQQSNDKPYFETIFNNKKRTLLTRI